LGTGQEISQKHGARLAPFVFSGRLSVPDEGIESSEPRSPAKTNAHISGRENDVAIHGDPPYDSSDPLILVLMENESILLPCANQLPQRGEAQGYAFSDRQHGGFALEFWRDLVPVFEAERLKVKKEWFPHISWRGGLLHDR